MSSPITIVKDESMVVDTSVPLKSMDTRGKSDTANTPCSTTSTSQNAMPCDPEASQTQP